MRIWKPKNKGKNYRKWYIELRDHQQIVRRFAGLSDKVSSRDLGRKIERLVSCKLAGEQPTPELLKWLEGVGKLRDKLVSWGLLDKNRAGKPLAGTLAEYVRSLKARERTEKYISETEMMLRRILTDCDFQHYSDIDAGRVENYLKELREGGLSYRRSNAYLVAAKGFCRWMVVRGYASESPLVSLRRLNVKLDKRHPRRAATLDEMKLLLTAVTGTRFGLTAYERALLYKFAAYTGLRANEIRTLTVSAFDFANRTVRVEAAYSKHRREDVLPLRPQLADELKTYLANRLPGAKAFRLTDHTSAMLRADLAEVGIEYVVDGKYFDFHSLRHTTGTLLAKSGVHPKVAQAAMRHSDIRITMELYTHTTVGQVADAVDSLPDFTTEKKGQKYGA